MNKLDTLLVNNMVLDNQLEDYFEQFDDYWDPYIVCMRINQQPIDNAIEKIKDFFIHCTIEVFTLDNDLIFFTLPQDGKSVKSTIDGLLNRLPVLHASVFKHNAINTIWVTIDRGLQLLEEAQEQHSSMSVCLYNDFTDRRNWPGVEKYLD